MSLTAPPPESSPSPLSTLQKTGLIFQYILTRSDSSKQKLAENVDGPTFYSLRLVLSSFAAGMGTGAYLAGTHRNHQFLAENAHRMPKTKGGFWKYNQAKHYAVIRHAGPGALKHGFNFAALTAVYAGIEYKLEEMYGENFGNAAAAGCVTALLFSASRLSLSSGKYAVLVGTGCGLSIGLLQDGYRYFNGVSIKMPSI